MLFYSFAGLKVKITGMDNAQYFRERLAEYEVDGFGNADITINHSEPYMIEKPAGKVLIQNYPRSWIATPDGGYGIYDALPNSENLMSCVIADKGWTSITTKLLDIVAIGGSPNDIRCFNMMGDIIKHAIIMHDGIILHASTIGYDGYGIAFSAPSGVGKSTHTSLWKEIYGENVHIINDDSPAIRFVNGTTIISGLPWSGTSGINKNMSLPLKAIICLERGQWNNISCLDSQNAIFRILNETKRPFYPEMMPILLKRVEQLIQSTSFYLLKCTIGTDAVDMVKNEIF